MSVCRENLFVFFMFRLSCHPFVTYLLSDDLVIYLGNEWLSYIRIDILKRQNQSLQKGILKLCIE